MMGVTGMIDAGLDNWLSEWSLSMACDWTSQWQCEGAFRKAARTVGMGGPLPPIWRVKVLNNEKPLAIGMCEAKGISVVQHTGESAEVYIHELAHWLWRGDDKFGWGHNVIFAALCWRLLLRAGHSSADIMKDAQYDLGRRERPGDTPATDAERAWAIKWAWGRDNPHVSAEALADLVVRDYRRWQAWQDWKARAADNALSLLRFAIALALAAPEILSRLV